MIATVSKVVKYTQMHFHQPLATEKKMEQRSIAEAQSWTTLHHNEHKKQLTKQNGILNAKA